MPIIPVIMCAGLFKTIAVAFGPSMLNIISETSDLYVLMNMLYDAAFYLCLFIWGITLPRISA